MWAVRVMMMMMMIKIVLLLICACLHVVADTSSGSAGFQALFVFGDSLLDCGNRRELKPTATSLPYPIIDADHRPYGRDFPTHLPTGRFSNGLVGADILASFMGLPYPPPYLQDRSNFMKGCSFASAGAKIVNNTRSYQFPRLHFIDQVRLFAEVQQQLVVQLGDVQAGYFLSKSLILTCLGANDYLSDYYTNIVQLINPSEEVFRQNLIASYSNYIQILYSLGARKFAVVSIAPLGCIPALEYLIQGDDTQCLSSINEEVRIFNVALLRMAAQLQEAYPDAHFVFLDSFDLSLDVATHPAKYGFLYGLRPCCLVVRERSVPLCIERLDSVCENAAEHVFWDFAHPSQALNSLIARAYWEGSYPVVNPINLQQLARL